MSMTPKGAIQEFMMATAVEKAVMSLTGVTTINEVNVSIKMIP